MSKTKTFLINGIEYTVATLLEAIANNQLKVIALDPVNIPLVYTLLADIIDALTALTAVVAAGSTVTTTVVIPDPPVLPT